MKHLHLTRPGQTAGMSEEHPPPPGSAWAQPGICSCLAPGLSAAPGTHVIPSKAPAPQGSPAPQDRRAQPRAPMQQSRRGRRLTARHIFPRDRKGTTAAQCQSDGCFSKNHGTGLCRGRDQAGDRGSACPEDGQHPGLQLPTHRHTPALNTGVNALPRAKATSKSSAGFQRRMESKNLLPSNEDEYHSGEPHEAQEGKH